MGREAEGGGGRSTQRTCSPGFHFSQPSEGDGVGHGTFVAGLIGASQQGPCPGLAPDSELHIFRLFTNRQTSFTSWFLEAFNKAIQSKLDVVNLSIGGPDFLDQPYTDKVDELTANGVIVVSAIGNDGPLFGTLNNPADLANVIGVGGLNSDDHIAAYSSRGMTLAPLPDGYGRFKPDIVTYGTLLPGPNAPPKQGCRRLSGTSVASPVVAGAIALLISSLPPARRTVLVNPASIKQVLMESAQRLPSAGIFEQGQGKLDLVAARQGLRHYLPHASIVPPRFDATDCPYMWPYCAQPLFHGGMPLVANLTVLNGMAVSGQFEETPEWYPDPAGNGDLLDVAISHSQHLWPWAGWLGLRISPSNKRALEKQEIAEGFVRFVVASPGGFRSEVVLPIRIALAPAPLRHRRLLWDQFHSLAYPAGYFPRDDLKQTMDPLDWNGDHPHTNFRKVFTFLRERGYFVDVLGAPFTCFDAQDYAALLIVDPEEEFFPEEVAKLGRDVRERGLSLIVVGDWYSRKIMRALKFFDENTRNWWFPETGGCNVPALNDLLGQFGMAFGSDAWRGSFSFGQHEAHFASGSSIARFPPGGRLLSTKLVAEESRGDGQGVMMARKNVHERVPIVGLWQSGGGNAHPSASVAPGDAAGPAHPQGGNIVLYGDSNCLDEAHAAGKTPCTWLLDIFLDFALGGALPPALEDAAKILSAEFVDEDSLHQATRDDESTLYLYSKVTEGKQGHLHQLRPLPACPSVRWSLSAAGRPQVLERLRSWQAPGLSDVEVAQLEAVWMNRPGRSQTAHGAVSGDADNVQSDTAVADSSEPLLLMMAGAVLVVVVLGVLAVAFLRMARRGRRLLSASSPRSPTRTTILAGHSAHGGSVQGLLRL